MDSHPFTRHEFTTNSHKTSYLTAGNPTGPFLIFVHGWPGIAETWKPQLLTFSSLGFHVVAPDTRGYGSSSLSRDVRDYSLERLVSDLAALLSHLQRDQAVWVGHDWGAGIVWALAAHHPEICAGVINLCVPYGTLEMGLEAEVALVNREIYPEDIYPYGQFDYQRYYETNSSDATTVLEANPSHTVKALFVKARPATYGQPARTSSLIPDGGWFGGASEAPDVPLDTTVLDPSMHSTLTTALTKTSFFGATAYYLNHDVNALYAAKSVNDGVLTIPVLFIEARYDSVCATSISRFSEPMRRYCTDLTECSVEAGHWVQMEKPREVNAAIGRWLCERVKSWWPGYWSVPFVSTPAKL
jgi:soluble epoxide hydrolase/lipid-phosphate phosphatase